MSIRKPDLTDELTRETGTVIMKAPLDGDTIPLEDFPDPVFAQGLLGIGVGFMPTSDVLLAPASGEVVSVFPGGHAVLMKTGTGLELLLHIGLDTVDMDGQGFEPVIKDQEHVEQGQPLIKFDREKIRQAGKPLHTALVVTNKEIIKEYALAGPGQVSAGRTPVFVVRPVH